jgi:hypothetical protein
MMAVVSFWFCSVKAKELLALGGHNVFKMADKQRVKDASCERVPPEVGGDSALIFRQPGGTIRC